MSRWFPVRVIKSPMLGTFHLATGVEVGRSVDPETILGRFTWTDWEGVPGNETLQTGVKCRILDICVKDGCVEYAQPMFKIEISEPYD
jgi:biotin carboxyl carrier protein